jgi:hypothetical protein
MKEKGIKSIYLPNKLQHLHFGTQYTETDFVVHNNVRLLCI